MAFSFRSIVFVALTSLLLAGCQHRVMRPNYVVQPMPVVSPPGTAPVPFPVNVQPAPAQGTIAPPFPQNPPPVQGNFQPAPHSGYYPPQPMPQRPEANVQLGAPEPMQSDPLLESKEPPEQQEPPRPQPKLREQEPDESPQQPKKSETTSPLPVGIPQFAIAKPNVTSGLRPMLDGGLDWLRDNNYKSVLHIVRPGEDDSADQKQVEKRGMKYLRLEVSPQDLTSRTVEQFNRLVADKENYPLFVYDKDGSLAGGMWYLHLRTFEFLSDSEARAQASTLGLRTNGEGPHQEMWLAIQNYLSRQGE